MGKISLLLPTRNRIWAVERLFESIIKTTFDCKNIEIVLYIDEDDIKSREISISEISLIKIVRPRETMGKTLNLCCKSATGDYLFNINDDVVFRTPDWDAEVMKIIKQYRDDIFLIYGNDLHKKEKSPTSPLISKTAFEIIGGFSPEGYTRFYIETHLLDIFAKLKKIGRDRIFYLHDVIFEHRHFVLNKAAIDDTYLSRSNYADRQLFVSLARDRYYQSLKLAQYIENFKTGRCHETDCEGSCED